MGWRRSLRVVTAAAAGMLAVFMHKPWSHPSPSAQLLSAAHARQPLVCWHMRYVVRLAHPLA